MIAQAGKKIAFDDLFGQTYIFSLANPLEIGG